MNKNKLAAAFLGLASIAMDCAALASSEDDGTSLAQAILEATNRHVEASAAPLTDEQLKDLEAATKAISRTSYYQVDVEGLEKALESDFAARKVDPSVARAPLIQHGLEVLVGLIGHGAALWSEEQLSAPRTANESRVREMRAGPIRIISLSSLGPKLGECADVIEAPGTAPFEAIVLDLRGNQGGVLSSVTTIVSQFIEPGREVFHFESGSSSPTTSQCRPSYRDTPLAIVVDPKTDSGALLIAAVLQSYKRAKVIGATKSRPFGTVHTLWIAPSGEFVLKLPYDELMYGKGSRLSDGITVDVEADVTDDAQMIEAARSALGFEKP